ncbi:MAG: component of cytosolic 80S ribosome and 60S large subunit [Monoraphidium minutum]|nr:MAG: component of cytosolic 80S ribosome and 60S large subunit [Monoraphidium minutum]
MVQTVSPQLVWELVKTNNSFLRKNLHGNIFSAEKGNLYAKHSYKYSGIVNDKAVDIREGSGGVEVTTKRAKTATKPNTAVTKAVSKKGARRAIKAVRKQVGSYRADLANAAAARMSAVHRSLRKAGAKK